MTTRICKRCKERPTLTGRHHYCSKCLYEFRERKIRKPKRSAAGVQAERARTAQRGTTGDRGYGIRHQELRERWRPKVERGDVACARCGLLIGPGEAWDLGHDDDDRTRYRGPEHRRCNRRTAAHRVERERQRLRPPQPERHSREW